MGLFVGVDEFGEGVGYFLTVDVELKAFGEKGVFCGFLGEGGLCGRVFINEDRFIDSEMWFDVVEEDFEEDVVPVLAAGDVEIFEDGGL